MTKKSKMQFPSSIQNLIEQFSKLPTIGRKSAERFVFYLLKQPQAELEIFAAALHKLKKQITYCQICGNISPSNPCEICADQKRDKTKICVVSNARDLILIENTKNFNGLYHVLNGNINASKNITADHLNIQTLLSRLKNRPAREIILALSPTFEGESTALYLTKLLKQYNIKISRLARGLPTGADLEYADEATLTNALKFRT